LEGVDLGHPIVTEGDGDALFPDYFAEDLLRFRFTLVTFFTL